MFGSYAREEATEQSDIGIAVEITAYMGLNFIEMADEIEALFGIKTDVVQLGSKTRILAICKKGYDIYVKENLLCL